MTNQGRCYSGPVSRVVRYVEAHVGEEIVLSRAAQVAGLSRSQFARRFRRETGTTLRAWITQVRLLRAAREVGAGDKVEAVMLAVGYRGKTHFYRRFKARFGATPARYRRGEGSRSG